MTDLDQNFRPRFSQPIRQIFAMLLVLVLAGAGASLALPRVLPVFEANPYLNGFILFVFVIGVIVCFWQVFQLIGLVRWIDRFADPRFSSATKAPGLLAPLPALLQVSGSHIQISALSARSILDSVAQRIEEVRDISRYIVNLLIFLGLLGTFYGLATTVPAVVDTIRSLAPQDGESGNAIFDRLMTGLESQLGGMGVAFASSLLGLAGSLIIGLLELLAGRGQTRFYRELEEWLSSITRLNLSVSDHSEQEQSALPYVINQLSEQTSALQQMFMQSEASVGMLEERLGMLVAVLQALTQRLEGDDQAVRALHQITSQQEQLIKLLGRTNADEISAENRRLLRSIDVQMLRVLEEITAGRKEVLSVLHKEIDSALRMLSASRIPRQPQSQSETLTDQE
ncbi:MAG: biopolymer transporter ExbB [Aestuariivita sp.]|nr:biopolymer transporter ExbB [Aestuariivita sp.]MCY4347412.1 biopolymer transporter ExbB [Aestuariivita sp.]